MKAALQQQRRKGRHMVPERTRAFRIYIIPIRWSTKRLHYYAPVRPKSASGRSVCAVLHVSPNLRVRFVVVANGAERAD